MMHLLKELHYLNATHIALYIKKNIDFVKYSLEHTDA